MRWLPVIFYCILGPSLVEAYLPPDPHLSVPLKVAALVAGILVSAIHLRRQSGRGRLGVAVGTGLGLAAGGMMWAMGLLAIAFLDSSGKHAALQWNLAVGLTFIMVVVPAPLGAICLGAPLDRPKS